MFQHRASLYSLSVSLCLSLSPRDVGGRGRAELVQGSGAGGGGEGMYLKRGGVVHQWDLGWALKPNPLAPHLGTRREWCCFLGCCTLREASSSRCCSQHDANGSPWGHTERQRMLQKRHRRRHIPPVRYVPVYTPYCTAHEAYFLPLPSSLTFSLVQRS